MTITPICQARLEGCQLSIYLSIYLSPRCITTKQSGHVQAKLAQLQEGITVLDARLRAEVAARSGDLLSQATALREADDTMQVCMCVYRDP